MATLDGRRGALELRDEVAGPSVPGLELGRRQRRGEPMLEQGRVRGLEGRSPKTYPLPD
jgi:hypothetical protein